MTTSDRTPWQKSDRERRLTAIVADAGIASTEALLAVLVALYRDRPDDLAHVQRVARIAARIAAELGLDDRQVADIERAGLAHDLGKLVVPEAPEGTVDVVTRADMHRWIAQLFAAHGILAGSPGLRRAAALVLASRECMDGSGFPHRLAGDAIPLGARILHVADTYDALQELCAVFAMPADSVNVELLRHAGSRFDADVVAAWLRLVDEQSMRAPAPPPVPARSTL